MVAQEKLKKGSGTKPNGKGTKGVAPTKQKPKPSGWQCNASHTHFPK